MTAIAPSTTGAGPLADLLSGHTEAIAAAQAAGNLNQYVYNTAGDAVVVIGPDVSQAPVGTHSATPSITSTGLTGPGIAYYDNTTLAWVKLGA